MTTLPPAGPPPPRPDITFKDLLRKWFDTTTPLGVILGGIMILVVGGVILWGITDVLPNHLDISWK